VANSFTVIARMTRSLIVRVELLRQKNEVARSADQTVTPLGNLSIVCDACGDVGKIAACTLCDLNICLTTTRKYVGCILTETLDRRNFICPLCHFKLNEPTPVSAHLTNHIFVF
jgi:hypothetical protein